MLVVGLDGHVILQDELCWAPGEFSRRQFAACLSSRTGCNLKHRKLPNVITLDGVMPVPKMCFLITDRLYDKSIAKCLTSCACSGREGGCRVCISLPRGMQARRTMKALRGQTIIKCRGTNFARAFHELHKVWKVCHIRSNFVKQGTCRSVIY